MPRRYMLALLAVLPLVLGAETTCIPKGAVTVEPAIVDVTPRVLTDEIKGAVNDVFNQKGLLSVMANIKKEQRNQFENVHKAVQNNGIPTWAWVAVAIAVLTLLYLLFLQMKQMAMMQAACRYPLNNDSRSIRT